MLSTPHGALGTIMIYSLEKKLIMCFQLHTVH